MSAIRCELPGGGAALFSTRAEGNLSTMRGEGHECGEQQRARLCDELGLRWLCAGPQVHGSNVQRVREQRGSAGQPVQLAADGRATDLREVGMMVLVADCVPVLVGGPGGVAALHAGWRGLAAGVLEEGVGALRELGAEAELLAVIGPCAGPCCYEVGPEVHDAFHGAHRHGRKLDLPALAEQRLLAAGVDTVEQTGVCTICDERFYSHRREATAAGRQAGIAWLA